MENQQNAAPDLISASLEIRGNAFNAGTLRDAGLIGPQDGPAGAEQVATALAQGGTALAGTSPAPATANVPPPPDAQNAAAAFALPGARPHEYSMVKLAQPGEEYTDAHFAFDKQARGWLSDASVPVGLGNQLIETMDKEGARWLGMDEGQREIHAREQQAMLKQLWGDNHAANTAKVRALIAESDAKSPGLAQIMDLAGAWNSASIMAWLSNHADTLAAVRGGKKP